MIVEQESAMHKDQVDELAAASSTITTPERRDFVTKSTTSQRQHFKRFAAVGTFLALACVGATGAYLVIPKHHQSRSIRLINTEASGQRQETFIAPDDIYIDSQDGSGSDDDSTPAFSLYDANGDGIISNKEYLIRLQLRIGDALSKLHASSLAQNEKDSISKELGKKYQKETGCVWRLLNRDRRNNGVITEDRFSIFYDLIKIFCLHYDEVNIPKEFWPVESKTVSTLQAVPVMSIPSVEPTSAPAPSTTTTPSYQESKTEAPSTGDSETKGSATNTTLLSEEPATDAPVSVSVSVSVSEKPATDVLTSEELVLETPVVDTFAKQTFRDAILSQLEDKEHSYKVDIMIAKAKINIIEASLQKLNDCIVQAVEKFDKSSANDQNAAQNAVNWINDTCVKNA